MPYEKLPRRKPERRIVDRQYRATLQNCSVRTVERQDKRGQGPRLIHITDRLVGYYEDELLDWIETRRGQAAG